MGFALKMPDDVASVESPEAKARIASSRLADIKFLLRRIAHGKMDEGDVDTIASVLLEAERANRPLTKQYVEDALRQSGRTPGVARDLSSAIFK